MVVNQTTDGLLSVIREIRLLRSDQVAQLDPLPAHLEGDPKELAKDLVRRGWLTTFQVRELWHGRAAGLVLGPYKLLELLGEGGMGQVFKALHQPLNRVVALKIIRPQLVANPTALRRFQREAQSAAQLRHDNIVLIFDHGSEGDRHYLSMEFVDGVDLAVLVKDFGPLPVRTACDYIRQAALGLQHAHDAGLIHRDIKPGNLFACRTHAPGRPSDSSGRLAKPDWSPLRLGGKTKILDLGLARLREQSNEGQNTSLTLDGIVIGTPDYMAPEQAKNSHEVDHRADLYSLGCTLYFLLSGRMPFPDGTMMEKLIRHQFEEIEPIARLRPETPQGVQEVIQALTVKDPDARVQSASLLADALVPFCKGDIGPPPTIPDRIHQPSERDRTPLPPLTTHIPVATAVDYIVPAAASPFAFGQELAPECGSSTTSIAESSSRPAVLHGGMSTFPAGQSGKVWLYSVGTGIALFVILLSVGLAGRVRKPEPKDPPVATHRETPSPKPKPVDAPKVVVESPRQPSTEPLDRYLPHDAQLVVHINLKDLMKTDVYKQHVGWRFDDWLKTTAIGSDILREVERCVLAFPPGKDGRFVISLHGIPEVKVRAWLRRVADKDEARSQSGYDVFQSKGDRSENLILVSGSTLVLCKGEEYLARVLNKTDAGRSGLDDEVLAAVLPRKVPSQSFWFGFGARFPFDQGTLADLGVSVLWGHAQVNGDLRTELNAAGHNESVLGDTLTKATLALIGKSFTDKRAKSLLSVLNGERTRTVGPNDLPTIRVQGHIGGSKLGEWVASVFDFAAP
jgi:serine/threonine-protein kinase